MNVKAAAKRRTKKWYEGVVVSAPLSMTVGIRLAPLDRFGGPCVVESVDGAKWLVVRRRIGRDNGGKVIRAR